LFARPARQGTVLWLPAPHFPERLPEREVTREGGMPTEATALLDLLGAR
jgi:hypothetical protein